MMTRRRWSAGMATLAVGTGMPALAQQPPRPAGPYARWAELEIDPARLADFRAAAQDNAAATLQEAGVVAFHYAAEKGNPGRIRVLEVYADPAAYSAHLRSTHFQRFAQALQSMAVARRVFDTLPIVLGAKPQAAPLAAHVRVAELEIDPARLGAYQSAVMEEIKDSIALEPGVLAIYSMALRDRPTHLRFFEIYADEAAYRAHIASAHFKKYVDTTKTMITARQLFEMESPSLGLRAR